MKLERIAVPTRPDPLPDLAGDCLWIRLALRAKPRPLQSALLQWIDYKLHGQISRFLVASVDKVTFIPGMRRIPLNLLALDPVGDWNSFQASCRGLQWKRVLYFCEDTAVISRAESELKNRLKQLELECVTLVTEAPLQESP